jgi:Bacteriophage Lambda NinG protein
MLARRRFLYRSALVEKRPETGSRRWLVAELDRLTSVIVRRRDRRCVTCGSREKLQCSHFYSRRHVATRFDLRNCNAMCARCNRQHNSDPSSYLRFMERCHGAEVLAELEGLRAGNGKVSEDELGELFERYKDMT